MEISWVTQPTRRGSSIGRGPCDGCDAAAGRAGAGLRRALPGAGRVPARKRARMEANRLAMRCSRRQSSTTSGISAKP
jgi:hypothetical protein